MGVPGEFENVRKVLIDKILASLTRSLGYKQPVLVYSNADKVYPQTGDQSADAEQIADYIRDLFIQSFGKSSVKPPYDRVIELTWLDAFVKLRSETVPCPHCGKETFIAPKYSVNCMYCGGQLTCTESIKFKRFELPAFGGAKLYEGMTGDTEGDFHKVIGEVVRNKKDPSKHALRNLTQDTWSVKLPDNTVKTVDPNGIMPINKGFVLTIGRSEGTVE